MQTSYRLGFFLIFACSKAEASTDLCPFDSFFFGKNFAALLATGLDVVTLSFPFWNLREFYTRYNPGMTYDGKPLSLRPMKFEDAVKELLKAKPEPKKPKPIRKPKRKTSE
jgi:hypothetical protein